MLIDDILWHQVQSRRNKLAVICGNTRLTYGDVAERTARLANSFSALGIRAGQRVAVLATNCAEYVETVFAIATIGATWVPLNFRLSPPELAYILNDSEPAAVIFTADLAKSVEGLRDIAGAATMHWIAIGAPTLSGTHSYDDLLKRSSPSLPVFAVDPDSLFAIMYTSGTTGHPKGVMLPHRRFFTGTILSTIALKAADYDVKLQAIPQFHAGGQIYQLCHLAAGATIVVMPRFEPRLALDLIREEGVTAAGFVPSMLVAMLEDRDFERTDFSRLQRVMYGGSPIPEDRLARAVDLMKANFLQTYGQTEAGVLVTVLDEHDHQLGLANDPAILRSCGRAMLGYDIRTVGEDGNLTQAVGELVVRSDSLMTGYWHRERETAATLLDGWLQTGDLARRDEEGRFYLVDRKKDLIVSGGENVYPIEVEHVLSSHPAILDVAVIGVPDERWGEAVKAILVRRPGVLPEAEAIIAFSRGKLGGFKIPKSIDFVDALPRNASGKIQKNLLRDPYWAGRSRKI